MKKMIPVYLLQILMLAAFLFVSRQVLNEMRSMTGEIRSATVEVNKVKEELESTKSSSFESAFGSATRVVIVNRE